MSSYKIKLVPGGISGKKVGAGITMTKADRSASPGNSTPGGGRLSVFVAIISSAANPIPDVLASDGAGFSEVINTAGDHVFADVQPGTYTVTANDIDDGNGNTLIGNVYQSPATLLPDEHACIFVAYCANATVNGVNLILEVFEDPDFAGSVFGGAIVLGIVNSANDVVARSDTDVIPISSFGPAGDYTAVVLADNSNGAFAISGLTTLTGVNGDTLTWTVIGNLI